MFLCEIHVTIGNTCMFVFVFLNFEDLDTVENEIRLIQLVTAVLFVVFLCVKRKMAHRSVMFLGQLQEFVWLLKH